uniref:Uncharacterized protein n=1 Tax=Cacopsylla melanoneura TaxID=428564 RepID=A0A8D8YAQ5_9HEMI
MPNISVKNFTDLRPTTAKTSHPANIPVKKWKSSSHCLSIEFQPWMRAKRKYPWTCSFSCTGQTSGLPLTTPRLQTKWSSPGPGTIASGPLTSTLDSCGR